MKVKLAISELTIPELIQVCAEIVAKMSGNPNFANPLPDLLDVGKAINNLSNDYKAALDGARSLKAIMHVSEKTLRDLMNQLAAYVQTASGGDQEIILSSGMKVYKKPAASTEMPTPVNLECLHTDRPTDAPLRWKSVPKRMWYMVECTQTPDDADSWKAKGTCSKAKFTVTGLLPGQQYWFRVAAGGPLGNSAWSDPAKRMSA